MRKSVEKELNSLKKIYKLSNIEDVDWTMVSVYQKLSEDLIREFQDKFWWEFITFFQDLSKDFIIEFKDKLNLEYLLNEKKISQQFYDELLCGKPKNRFQLLDFSEK